MANRKIVKIDEDKCTGCGLCVPSCHEGALQIIDGKAKLVAEVYCDGLGACLGECPEDAIIIEDREAEEFDPVAVEEHLASQKHVPKPAHVCPGSAVRSIKKKVEKESSGNGHVPSELTQWPVQLTLVPAQAPYLKGADVLLTADCVPFAMGDFHTKLLRDHVVLIACPKLDNAAAHTEKVVDVLENSGLKSLSVVHMEVSCCFGLQQIAEQAYSQSGSEVPLKEIVVGIDGELK
jgi:ferredoxin